MHGHTARSFHSVFAAPALFHGLSCPAVGVRLPFFGARAAPAARCPVRQTQLVTLHLLSGCCIPLPGSPAELSPTCTHMQGSGASAGNPLSSSLVLGLAGQPASKENFQLVSLFSEAAWLRCWLSVALKPAWEWARLPHSSWVDSH